MCRLSHYIRSFRHARVRPRTEGDVASEGRHEGFGIWIVGVGTIAVVINSRWSQTGEHVDLFGDE